jgi:hypothetical protein
MNQVAVKDYQVLDFLTNLKAQGSVEANSAILTGSLNAINNVISPEIIAGIITAKTIRADRIEGLEIYTDKLASLSAEVAVLSASTQSGSFAATTSGTIDISALNILGDQNTKGNSTIEGMLTVIKSITAPNLLISDFASFFGDVLFKGNVKFEGRPTFNSDTAGFAVIKAGQTSVNVNFDNEYQFVPVVTASIALPKTDDTKLEDAILSGNISYVITQRTTKGFVIKLNKAVAQDVSFSWVSLSVDKAKTFNSDNTPATVAPVTPDATKSAAFQSVLNQLNSR